MFLEAYRPDPAEDVFQEEDDPIVEDPDEEVKKAKRLGISSKFVFNMFFKVTY